MDRISQLSKDEYYKYKNYFQELFERNALLNMDLPLISFDDTLKQIYLNSFKGCVYDDIVYVPNGITCINIKETEEVVHSSGYSFVKGYKTMILPDTVKFIYKLESSFDYLDTSNVSYIGEECENVIKFVDYIKSSKYKNYFYSSIIVLRDSLDISNINVNLSYKKLIIAKSKNYSLKKCDCIKDNRPDDSQIYIDNHCITYGNCKSTYFVCSQYDNFERGISVSPFTCVNAQFIKASIDDIIGICKKEKGIV